MAKWQDRKCVSCGWVLKTGSNLVEYQCSKCNRWAVKWEGTMDYEKCPHCGADMGVKDELNRVRKELNSEIEKSKSEIVPDYRDGWRLREGEASDTNSDNR